MNGLRKRLSTETISVVAVGVAVFPSDGRSSYPVNAWIPVCALPRIKAWMSWVPS